MRKLLNLKILTNSNNGSKRKRKKRQDESNAKRLSGENCTGIKKY